MTTNSIHGEETMSRIRELTRVIIEKIDSGQKKDAYQPEMDEIYRIVLEDFRNL